jgi:hypothetical protein
MYRIIYPAGIDSDAMRVANTLEHVRPAVIKTSRKTRRINVILRSRLAESDGYSTIVPRKMEFFNLPPQGSKLNGVVDWYSLLSIHEFRHITQFSRLDTGYIFAFHILFGPQLQGGLSMLLTPGWWFEGDAVATETALTHGGRGRNPQFTVEQKALLLAGKNYKYEKVFCGSYKDWYPSDMNYS